MRRNTVPPGPSWSKRPLATAAPSWTEKIESSTRLVGGAAPAIPRSRPKPWMVDDLPFGGILEPSVVCVVGSSAGLSPRRGQVYHRPRRTFSMLEEDLQGGGEQEHQRRYRHESQAQVEQHARRGWGPRVAHGLVDVQADPTQDRCDEELRRRGRRDRRYEK